MKRFNVAIDGPAGAGKSTVARETAKKLGFIYIDTGAMYRALTWKALQLNVSLEDETELNRIAALTVIDLSLDEDTQQVWVDNQRVTNDIRSPEVTKSVSQVSAYAGVRESMVVLQRQLAVKKGVVMDGRDIGTFVLPDAEIKIFLTASEEERARRRFDEMIKQGLAIDFVQLKEAIILRDKMDSEREVSPLIQAEDAILIDSTGRSIEEIVFEILTLCRTKMGGEE